MSPIPLTEPTSKAEMIAPYKSPSTMQAEVAKRHGITEERLLSRSKEPHLVLARWDLWARLYRQSKKNSAKRIARMYGRDTTTVHHGLRMMGVKIRRIRETQQARKVLIKALLKGPQPFATLRTLADEFLVSDENPEAGRNVVRRFTFLEKKAGNLIYSNDPNNRLRTIWEMTDAGREKWGAKSHA